jgi:tetratricopeptide (TPR) repeat protein
MFKIKRKQTEDIKGLTTQAMQYHQSGNLHRAEALYRKVLKEQPGNFDVLHMLGVLYAQLKNREFAVKSIEKALKIKPDSAYAWYNLGNVYRDNSQFDKASPCYQKVMELHRNDDEVQDDLGVTIKDRGPLKEILINHQPGSHNKTILISIPVFNRKKITRLSLAQTKRYKTPYCHLQVYNDHSTEYDNDFLAPYADEVIQLPSKKGIHSLRWHQFREFLKTDFDFIYMTDGDVIHDPRFIAVLEVLYETGDGKLPVCLFNSAFHMEPRIILYRKNGVMLKGTAPGVSMFYDRAMVEKIVSMLDRHHDTSIWDYTALKYLGLPWVTPETSYLEHYGGGGIHNADYERDRAINPTPYLQKNRKSILGYLMHDDEAAIDF